MDQWAYQQFRFPEPGYAGFVDWLNAKGLDGWEYLGKTGQLYIFKRKKDDLDASIDKLHGPGASAAIDSAIAAGHFD